jgi:hypothetical protein
VLERSQYHAVLERSQYGTVESLFLVLVLLYGQMMQMTKKEDSIDESIPMLLHTHDYNSFLCLSWTRKGYQDHHPLSRQIRDNTPVPKFASIHPDQIAFVPSMR